MLVSKHTGDVRKYKMAEDYEREYREKLAQVNVQMSILAQDMRKAGLDEFAARLEALREDVPYEPDRGTRTNADGTVTRLEACEVKSNER